MWFFLCVSSVNVRIVDRVEDFTAMKDSVGRMFRLRSHTLCNLPEEVLVHLFKFLPLRDLINTRQVCSQFKWLIDSASHLWTTATLVNQWPNNVNFKHFERAANMDNVEALIKLGVACLYNEGYPQTFESDTHTKGRHAAEYLCQAERLLKGENLFLWALIRPPWSKNGACCKATVYQLLKDLVINSKECDRTALYCIARINIILQEEDEGNALMSKETEDLLTQAAQAGSQKAALQLWQYREKDCKDPAARLDRIRQLREIVNSQPSKVSKMELFSAYAKGNFGGLLESQAAEATRAYIQESETVNSKNIFNVQTSLNNEMRYILVDWLVEVANMKRYSSHTLHMVVSCVDRYLMHHPITRGNLQLLGITAMVICSRLLEPDLITIREAAWLTDGTYRYEEVVRMMGDILATLRGRIEVSSMWEYLILYFQLANADRKLKFLSLYISELTLLHVEFGQYSLALQAASIFYLAQIISCYECPWTSKLVEFTGFQPGDLVSCTLHVHKKCFFEEPPSDHRNVRLSAVKERYAETEFLEVSKIAVLDHATLRAQLYVRDEDPTMEEKICPLPSTPTPCGRVEPFLMSPSRSSRSHRHHEDSSQDREDLVSTPTGELSTNTLDRSLQDTGNESFMSLESGYDADMESDADTQDREDASQETVHEPQAKSPSASNCPYSTIPSQKQCLTGPSSPNHSVPAVTMEANGTMNDASAPLDKRTEPTKTHPGKSYKIDSNGKLRLGSPRQPLKRLENGRCHRKSKQHPSNRRNIDQLNQGENAHTEVTGT